jgi:ATP-dependent DNA helicase RecG
MAPTEILARQHFDSIRELLGDLPVPVELLTGSTKTAARKKALARVADGEVKILIGTHALIETAVQFRNLGLAIIDEQHRFGVEQRAKLREKSEIAPHILVMTATPIPRTLAMTLYGDLDVSIIDELPPGRKPIQTEHRTDSHRLAVWGFLKKQIKEGRQVYIVYPLIEESAKLDLKNLEAGYAAICHDFPMPEYKVSIVHGKMKPKDKEFEMQRFVKGQTNIIIFCHAYQCGYSRCKPSFEVFIFIISYRTG